MYKSNIELSCGTPQSDCLPRTCAVTRTAVPGSVRAVHLSKRHEASPRALEMPPPVHADAPVVGVASMEAATLAGIEVAVEDGRRR